MVSTHIDRFKTVNLDSSVLRNIVSLLHHSYSDEPNYQHLLDVNRTGYAQRLRATFREIVSIHFQKGEQVIGIIDTQNDILCGVALVVRNKHRASLSRSIKWRVKMLLTAGFDSTVRFMSYQDDIRHAVATDEFQIVTQLAIHPKFRQMGLGEQLLDAVFDDCAHKANCKGVYLDSGNPKYTKFYERMGFAHVTALDIGGFQEHIYMKVGPGMLTESPEQLSTI